MPSKKRPFKKISIIGLGLIGSSIALAIKKRKLAEITSGYSRSLKTRTIAKKLKLTSEIKNNISPTSKELIYNSNKLLKDIENDLYIFKPNIDREKEKNKELQKKLDNVLQMTKQNCPTETQPE